MGHFSCYQSVWYWWTLFLLSLPGLLSFPIPSNVKAENLTLVNQTKIVNSVVAFNKSEKLQIEYALLATLCKSNLKRLVTSKGKALLELSMWERYVQDGHSLSTCSDGVTNLHVRWGSIKHIESTINILADCVYVCSCICLCSLGYVYFFLSKRRLVQHGVNHHLTYFDRGILCTVQYPPLGLICSFLPSLSMLVKERQNSKQWVKLLWGRDISLS